MNKDIKIKVMEYITPYYKNKDMMHNLSHINRVIIKAKELSKNYDVDFDLIEICVYFHGIIKKEETKIKSLLRNLNVGEDKIDRIINISKASHKDVKPETIEEKILHDAHILEGGKYFQIVKSLITGTARGQSLEETLEYFEQNIIEKFQCHLPESRDELKTKENYSEDVLKDIKQSINLEVHK